MRPEQLKIIFKYGTFTPRLALTGIQAVFVRHGMPITDFTLHNESVHLTSLPSKLEKSNRNTFNLIGQGFEFLLGSVRHYHLDFLQIKSANAPSRPWDEWVGEFSTNPNFVMAWVVDSEYDYWQNAEDPLQYTSVGKSYAHLPMKSNRQPYPVEKEIIDTSINPGRWCFRDGYIEAVGSVMWLGAPFWQLTDADQKRVANTPWLQVQEPAPAVMRIQAAKQCFTTPDNSSGELQARLRSFLFGVADLACANEHENQK
jgi:hypothetical protein